MDQVLSSQLTGIVICIFAYSLGVLIKSKIKLSAAHPLVTSAVLVMILIRFSPVTMEQFQAGGSIISMFILPATTVLALNIYNQWDIMKENIVPVFAGCFSGAVVSLGSIYFLSKAMNISDELIFSILPKSVTTSIALELSEKNGGIGAVTVSAVMFTGVLCAVTAPFLVKVFRMKDPVAAGTATGSAGHAIGTSKAVEMGETQGAVSGIALALSGIIMSLLYLFM